MRGETSNQNISLQVSDRPDAGATFIESLIAIVLLGTVVLAVLTAVRTSVIATSVDRDHANAHAWLQSATDLIYGSGRIDCGTPTDSAATKATTKNAVINGYQTTARSVINAEGWAASNITVANVLYWNGDIYQDTCYDDVGIRLQLLTIRVTDPTGQLVEEVEVVKGA